MLSFLFSTQLATNKMKWKRFNLDIMDIFVRSFIILTALFPTNKREIL